VLGARLALLVIGGLPVPHLPTGVAGIGQDLRDRPQRPRLARPVPVAGPIVPGRWRHTKLVQGAGDPRRAAPGQPLREDPPHLRRGHRIWIKPVQPSPPPGMRPVRVRPGIDQTVPVRRPTTQLAALLPGLHPHRRHGAEPGPPRLMSEQHQQRLMRRVSRVDRSTDLGQP
jgi:hypothetical protein